MIFGETRHYVIAPTLQLLPLS